MNLRCLILGHDWRYMRCTRCVAWRPARPARQVPVALNPPMVHQLKTLTPYIEAQLRGEKNFEVRLLDRDYQVGDLCLLTEWLPDIKQYGWLRCTVQITYILPGGQYGIEPGYGVLGTQLVR